MIRISFCAIIADNEVRMYRVYLNELLHELNSQRHKRMQESITLKELSEYTGISRQSLSQLKHHPEVAWLRYPTIEALCEFFKISEEELYLPIEGGLVMDGDE